VWEEGRKRKEKKRGATPVSDSRWKKCSFRKKTGTLDGSRFLVYNYHWGEKADRVTTRHFSAERPSGTIWSPVEGLEPERFPESP
jgi:hypothetical protein